MTFRIESSVSRSTTQGKPTSGDIGCRLANRGAATIDDPNPLHILCVVPFMAHWFPYMRKNRFDLEWGPRIDLVAHFLRDVQDWWLHSGWLTKGSSYSAVDRRPAVDKRKW